MKRDKPVLIVREIEICPACGAFDPWIITHTRYATRPRRYARCRVCGQKAVIVFRPVAPDENR